MITPAIQAVNAPATEAAVYALLAIIADPEAAQKRLDELVAARIAVLDAQEAAKAVLDSARSAKGESDDREKVMLARENAVKMREDDAIAAEEAAGRRVAEAHSKELANQQEGAKLAVRIAQDTARLNERERAFKANVAATESAMRAREHDCATREAAAKQMMEAAIRIKTEAAEKLNQAQQLAKGTP